MFFAKRQFAQALKCYQQVLKQAPTFLPDPRIGIGLCFYSGPTPEREKAKKAWERSIAVVRPAAPVSVAPS